MCLTIFEFELRHVSLIALENYIQFQKRSIRQERNVYPEHIKRFFLWQTNESMKSLIQMRRNLVFFFDLITKPDVNYYFVIFVRRILSQKRDITFPAVVSSRAPLRVGP